MNITNALVPFNGTKIITVKVDNIVYVAMRPIVEAIGLRWASQTVKLNRNRDKWRCFDIETPTRSGTQLMLCIPLNKLNGWLFSVNPEKVRSDLKAKLIQYQEECFTALYDYWTKGMAVRDESWQQARHISAATYKLVSHSLAQSRLEVGKNTAKYHYSNEARMINSIITGEFTALNRERLNHEQLDILGKLQLQDSLLLLRGMVDYHARKQQLEIYYRTLITPALSSQSMVLQGAKK